MVQSNINLKFEKRCKICVQICPDFAGLVTFCGCPDTDCKTEPD